MRACCRLAGPLVVFGILASGCAGTVETRKEEVPASAPLPAKESIYHEGMRLYGGGQTDSAAALLEQASDMDSTWLPPLKDLARLQYDRTMQASGGARLEAAEKARRAYVRLERRGGRGEDVYERICDLSSILGDDRTYLRYAEKNLALHPSDRQYYNVGLAYSRVGDDAAVIRTQKEAVQKFPGSHFVAGFYRQLGSAYERVDRDQTAEKTFTEGVKAADAVAARFLATDPAYGGSADSRRLMEDKVAMLLALKKLHQRYGDKKKLNDVERQLRETGHAQ